MAYIYNEMVLDDNIYNIRSLLDDIKFFDNDEINEIISKIEDIVEDIDNNFDTTDALFEEITDDFKRMIEFYQDK